MISIFQNNRIFRCAVLASLLLLLPAQATWAGSVTQRKDGTTVVTVSLHKLPDPASTSAATRANVAVVREFTRRFPKIFAEKYRAKYQADPKKYGRRNWDKVEIRLKQFTGISVVGVETDLLAIAGGVPPDVLYVNFRKSDNYIQDRFLYPLDKPQDGYITDMTKAQIAFRVNPKVWPVIRRKGPDGQVHVWALPTGGALGKVLLYRKDLFDEYDVPYPTADWTWDDLLAACRKLTDPKRGNYALELLSGYNEAWNWITYLWSAGGEVMTYNEKTDQWRCVFDSRAAAEALDFYLKLVAEKWTDKDGKVRRGYAMRGGQAGVKWGRGEIAMKFDYIDEKLFSTINPELLGMAPVPMSPKGTRAAELNCRMAGLFSQIKEPAVRDAAWEYLKFYACKDAERIRTRVMVEGGLGRFVNPKYLTMFGYPEIIRLAPKGWSEIFDIAIATGKPEPYGRNSNLAYIMMTRPMRQAESMLRDDTLPKDREERLDVLHDLLKTANAQANEEMIGIITPSERRKRDITAVVVIVAILVGYVFIFRAIIQAFTPPRTDGLVGKRVRWGFRKYAWAYILLIPAAGTVLVWQYIPLLSGSVMAFQDYRLLGDSAWVGLRNFGDLLFENEWWLSCWDALRYSFLVMALSFLPPIVLAILLQEVPKGRLLFRTLYYLPAVITGLVVMLLWKEFYEPSERGVLNKFVMALPAWVFLAVGLALLTLMLLFAKRLLYHELYLGSGVFVIGGLLLLATAFLLSEPILFHPGETTMQSLSHFFPRVFQTMPEPFRWLQDPDTAMLSIVIPMVWAGVGPGCLIYLAALKGIPEDYYEAADVDGATFIDKILFVVFPILKPLILINFLGVFIASFYGAAGNIIAMTGGGAGSRTTVASLYIWFKAFTFLKFGPATAAAWVLAFMLIGFTMHQLRILSRLEFRTTGDKDKK